MMKEVMGRIWSSFAVLIAGICVTWKNDDQKWTEDVWIMVGKKGSFQNQQKIHEMNVFWRALFCGQWNDLDLSGV
jgi:hypothetical protein